MIGQPGDPQSILFVISGGLGAGVGLVSPIVIRFVARALGHKPQSCRENCTYDKSRCERNGQQIARIDATQTAMRTTLSEIKTDLRAGFSRLERRLDGRINHRS